MDTQGQGAQAPSTQDSSARAQSGEPSPRRPSGGGARLVVVALVSAALGGFGYRFFANPPAPTGQAESPAVAQARAKRPQRWQCPMHPTVVQDHPGDCPICGMRLLPIEEEGDGGAPAQVAGSATVTIDPDRQQLIGLRTARVTLGPIGGAVRTTGRVVVDETRVHHLNVKFSGFAEHVHADFIGHPVKKGEPLFSIYSPELLAAEEELVLALSTREALSGAKGLAGNGEDLVAAARRKLELWDIPQDDLDRIERTRKAERTLTIRSPASGVVVKKDVVPGMKVEAGGMPYEIVDLSSIWVLADVYETELSQVKVGAPAQLLLKAMPDRPYTGRVAFIDPYLDAKTRTAKVRLVFQNPGLVIKPEMFGEVVLKTAPKKGLRAPVDAVINSGTQSVVFLALGDGKFAPREVRLGQSDGRLVEVLEGVKAGDELVDRANFLVDSESRLKASLQALEGAKAAAPAQHEHGAHEAHGGHEGHEAQGAKVQP
jgi:membrane fusion protein, copper/silver efflux system